MPTISNTVSVACPKCHASGEAEIWTCVNNVATPDEAQWLIDGFLFHYECPECGNVSTLNHDCLYEDERNKAFVLYVADSDNAEETFNAVDAHKPAGYYTRLVDSVDVLREKAAMLRDGLDDRAVEVAKQAVFNRLVATGQVDKDARVLYGALAEDGGVIVEFVTSQGTTETTVPADVYRGIADSFTDAQPPVVDRVWAMNVLNMWE